MATDASSHVCFRYDGREQLLAATLPFVRDGLARGERCVYIAADEAEADGVRRSLAREVAASAGDLAIFGPDETYLRGGEFVPERVIDWITAQAEIAIGSGLSGFRLVGETVAIGRPPKGHLEAYESALNALFRGDRPIRVLCGYDHGLQSASTFREAITTHPVVWVRGRSCRNPHYLPPDEYLAPTRPRGEVDGILERLWLAEQAGELQRDVSRALRSAQEQERRALARELHDELGQILVAVQLRHRDGDAATRGLVEDALEIVRTLAFDLGPSMLDDLGLAAALRTYVCRRTTGDGLAVELELGVLDGVPAMVATTCYRIVQEAVTNVARHASARRAVVRVVVDGDQLVLAVQDDGLGFDVAARTLVGLGLLAMAERVDLAGGEISVTSTIGAGTTIQATLPLAERRP